MTTIIKGNLELGLRKFKADTAKSGTLSKARERNDGYKKPGVRRREEKKINTMNSRRNNKNSRRNDRNK